MNIIKKILSIWDKFIEWVAMFFLILMVVIISIQVFTRYFLNMTPFWSEEIALMLMVWFGFLGIAVGVKREIHLSIEYFVRVLPLKIQWIVGKIVNSLTLLFGVALFWYGLKLVEVTGYSTLPATQLPASALYIMVPVSGIMIAIYSLEKLIGIESEV